jgi:hypothetical protein
VSDPAADLGIGVSLVQAGQRIFAGRQINSGDGWHVRGDRAPYRGAACIVIDRGGGLMLRAAD